MGFGDAKQQLQGQRSKRLTAGQHSQRFEATDFDEFIQTPPPKQKSTKEKASKSKSQKLENNISKDKSNAINPQQHSQITQQQQAIQGAVPNQFAAAPDKQNQIKMYNDQLMMLNQQFQQLKNVTDHPNPQQQQQQLMEVTKQMQKTQWQLEKEYIIVNRGFMDPGLKNFIATVINEGNVGDEVMEGALGVIQAGVSIESGDEGLVEVEIDQIDDATLWKLHDYLRSQNVLGQNIPPQVPPQAQQIQQPLPPQADQMQQ